MLEFISIKCRMLKRSSDLKNENVWDMSGVHVIPLNN